MRTGDHRGYGGVGLGDHDALCAIADDTTTASGIGAIARAIIHALIDWYVSSGEVMMRQTLLAQLELNPRNLSNNHPSASASYAIASIRIDGVRLVQHASDCLLGADECEARRRVA